jgi:phosphoribosylformimino-5-aminoimidazole carboxamide ribotide isomerase
MTTQSAPEFVIYPAIDLRGGRVVRLVQGRAEKETVYGIDPAATAQRWTSEGARWLHVVDLDRALGEPDSPNTTALQSILATVTIPVQFGGGLRTLETMRRALALGVSRIVLGTVAVEEPQIVAAAVQEFGAEQIAIAIDSRAGMVATRGWVASSGTSARDLGKRVRELGAERAIVTDIARDGMLQGIDASAMAEFARATGLRVIASGGVASLDDVRQLRRAAPDGVEGVIIGQALYAGVLTLQGALDSPAPGKDEERRPHEGKD